MIAITRRRLEAAGLDVRAVELDELAKAEGAVTCCSIVFEDGGTPERERRDA